MFDINLVTSAIILIKSLSALVEINETNAPVMVCTEFLAFAHLNLYMVHLAVPIKGLMRMMADKRHSLIYFLSWGSGGCGVYSQNFGRN